MTPDANAVQDDLICIYFTDEPLVDAVITREELRAALERQHAVTSLQIDDDCTIR